MSGAVAALYSALFLSNVEEMVEPANCPLNCAATRFRHECCPANDFLPVAIVGGFEEDRAQYYWHFTNHGRRQKDYFVPFDSRVDVYPFDLGDRRERRFEPSL
jgi:hypothetical protein